MIVLQPWHWIAFGLILAIIEMFIPTFFVLWFGVSAVIVGILSYVVSPTLPTAIVIWAILSALLCLAWFKFIAPTLKTRTKAGLGGSVIIGEIGMIVQSANINGVGKIRFSVPKVGASEWLCRFDTPIAVGERAVVVQVLGNELLVGKLP